ncbi:PREDICTED: paramyosin, short form-like [Polistes dominula]|uniref:Paramyosin, short form-like n=1 Tax=Polistes dominula TaxID=743375 RepID=A0ABM1IYS7_POLDO|nr:PREDICTED: paramyosin, short form-like [Polistes dominula]
MAGYMPPNQMPLEPRWHHWPTYVYDKNYGYGMNYYQPMLDYIDRKKERSRSALGRLEGNGRRVQLPDLPWSDGRFLWEDQKLQTYDKESLIKRAIDAEDQARDHLSRFKIKLKEASI